jgi:Na+-transporting NADH:ubiquinone oxidoreductase subunit F
MYNTYLKNHEAPEDIEYYLCGPGPMTKSVQKLLYDLGVDEGDIMFDDFS